MAKREISTTLKNLKFMQRAAQREEKIKDVEEAIPSADFSSCIIKKCVVIVEGDPHPGISRGRMSFQSFNPSIDKPNEEGNLPGQPETSTTCSGNRNGKFNAREDESNQDEYVNLKLNRSGSSMNGDIKRKQPEVQSEIPSPNKSMKNGSRNFDKQSKDQKLDWSVLRPPKSQNE